MPPNWEIDHRQMQHLNKLGDILSLEQLPEEEFARMQLVQGLIRDQEGNILTRPDEDGRKSEIWPDFDTGGVIITGTDVKKPDRLNSVSGGVSSANSLVAGLEREIREELFSNDQDRLFPGMWVSRDDLPYFVCGERRGSNMYVLPTGIVEYHATEEEIIEFSQKGEFVQLRTLFDMTQSSCAFERMRPAFRAAVMMLWIEQTDSPGAVEQFIYDLNHLMLGLRLREGRVDNLTMHFGALTPLVVRRVST